MTKKINSKLLISLCLVVVLVVCALSMMACNKKKGDTSSSTSLDVVTGETTMAIDNVAEFETINIPQDYSIITPDAKYTKVSSVSCNNGAEYWIVKEAGSQVTVNHIDDSDPAEVLDNYYVYDLLNKKIVTQISPFTTYYVVENNVYYKGNYYKYAYIYTATVQNKRTSGYKYIGQVYDMLGNYLTPTLMGDIGTCYSGSNQYVFTNNDLLNFDSRVTVGSTAANDAVFGIYITATFVDNQGVGKEYMASLENWEIQLKDDDSVVPTFDAGNKYLEKTAVPGLDGYFYVIDRSKNTIFFYDSYISSSPKTKLVFDFGELGIDFKESCILGGKVFLYGQVMLPATATDFDYYLTESISVSPPISYSVKVKNAMYVFDIKSGELNQILQGYVIKDNYKLFIANNNKPYMSVELRSISEDKIPSATSKYYVVDSEGNILVSTPELFDVSHIVAKFSNGGYGYQLTGGTHVYILDKYLNTVTKADYITAAQNNAFLASDEAGHVYSIDLTGTIRNTNINRNDYAELKLYGDYIICKQFDDSYISYAIGTASYTTIYDATASTATTCTNTGKGVFIVKEQVGTTYTYKFISCTGRIIGEAITGVTTSDFNFTALENSVLVVINNVYYYIA